MYATADQLLAGLYNSLEVRLLQSALAHGVPTAAVDRFLQTLTERPADTPLSLLITQHANLSRPWQAVVQAYRNTECLAWKELVAGMPSELHQLTELYGASVTGQLLLELLDPLVAACDFATNPNVVGSNGELLDILCQRRELLMGDSPFAFQ